MFAIAVLLFREIVHTKWYYGVHVLYSVASRSNLYGHVVSQGTVYGFGQNAAGSCSYGKNMANTAGVQCLPTTGFLVPCQVCPVEYAPIVLANHASTF